MVMNFTSNIKEVIQGMDTKIRVTIPQALEDSGEDMLAILTNETRKYIPSGHRLAAGQKNLSTGRLWSSWGIAERRTSNEDYNPEDAIADVKVVKGRSARINVIVGTKVPYAKYANDGRPLNQGRTAYHFVEKGQQDSERIISNRLDQNINAALVPIEQQRRSRQFNAARQKRDVLGRFGSILRR